MIDYDALEEETIEGLAETGRGHVGRNAMVVVTARGKILEHIRWRREWELKRAEAAHKMALMAKVNRAIPQLSEEAWEQFDQFVASLPQRIVEQPAEPPKEPTDE